MPLIILFTPAVYLVIKYFDDYEGGCMRSLLFCPTCVEDNCNNNCLLHLLCIILFIPIIFALGLAVGAVALAFLIVPAYLF